MTDKNALLVEEQALYEQEQGVLQMEAQIHAQEQGVAHMEKAFGKKNKALLNLATFVKKQETDLLSQAEGLGPKVASLARELLSRDTSVGSIDLDLGRFDDRQVILQRRREQLQQRMALIEEREALYAARADSLERADSQVAELHQKLVRRQAAVSEAAGRIISASSTLIDEDDEEGDPAGYASSPTTIPGLLQRAPAEAIPQTSAFGRPATGRTESTQVFTPAAALSSTVASSSEDAYSASGSSESADDDEDGVGGVSRAEDKATRRRASARARVRTNQFKITLEAVLESTEPHHFFRYENDGADDLPGLFIATPNLLKVGREVRVRVGRDGRFLEATGIVAWRRQRGDAGGVPGMGIELLNLSEPERQQVGKWTQEKAPVTI
jgi:hypothetical protein